MLRRPQWLLAAIVILSVAMIQPESGIAQKTGPASMAK